MAVPSHTPKHQLRTQALAARNAYAHTLDASTRDALETSLARQVLPHLMAARIIGGYYPMRDEISPLPLLDSIAAGQRLALPWFADRDSRMIFRGGPASVVGPWGTMQPSDDAPALSPDMLLVPLVLADAFGTRVGRGKGHYDRALSHLREAGPLFTIGIAWQIQVSDEVIPADPWDVPLDALATPAEWIDCRQMREKAGAGA